MFYRRGKTLLGTVIVALLTGAAALVVLQADSVGSVAVAVPRIQSSLSVNVTKPEFRVLPTTIAANGDIAAWREISIGTEISDLRLAEVMVDVGDEVEKGQLLAVYAAETVRVDLMRSRAALAEAEAAHLEAVANGRRARGLKQTGSLSGQQIQRYETAELTARARLDVAQAEVEAQELRLALTRIVAPDAGLITSRMVAVGTVTGSGRELFRLIQRGRLEWRAEVAASDLEQLAPGQIARITLPGGHQLEGRVRIVAPAVDASTRNGLVYVDLPPGQFARAGMFARGQFELGTRRALTLPRSAVQIRDGFGYVHRVSDANRITETKVALGQHIGDRIEILSELAPDVSVVAAGGAFLGSGDQVQVIEDGESSGDPFAPVRAAGVVTSTSVGRP